MGCAMELDQELVQGLYRFNTWANGHIRDALLSAEEASLRQPLGLWFGSVFAVVAHICAGEAIWLARLRDGSTPARLLAADDYATIGDLVQTWRDLDADWEAYIATLDAARLTEPVSWTSQLGDGFTHTRWQLVLHVPFHSSEHRAQAALALTTLGIAHGPQDFHLQFMPPEAAARRMGLRPSRE
jgi:uncharacterized damage-inducible protein DinB